MPTSDPCDGNLRREELARWSVPLAQGAVAGSLASVLSSAVLMWMGRREAGAAAAPANATSHWLWGREALHRDRVDLRHTLAGYLIHHGAATLWATAYAAFARQRPRLRSPAGIVAGAAATSALACFVDFRLTPQRLTPGFEHRLSRPALAGVYGALAVGLALGAWALRDRYPQDGQAARHSRRPKPLGAGPAETGPAETGPAETGAPQGGGAG